MARSVHRVRPDHAASGFRLSAYSGAGIPRYAAFNDGRSGASTAIGFLWPSRRGPRRLHPGVYPSVSAWRSDDQQHDDTVSAANRITQTDVGIVQGGIGLAATIAGLLAGGAVIGRIGLNRTRFCFDAGHDNDREFLRRSGNSCPRRASDGALQSTILSNTIRAALEPGCDRPRCHGRARGSIVARIGWPIFYLLSIAAAISGLALLPFFSSDAVCAVCDRAYFEDRMKID